MAATLLIALPGTTHEITVGNLNHVAPIAGSSSGSTRSWNSSAFSDISKAS
jgi:hypothetical protein